MASVLQINSVFGSGSTGRIVATLHGAVRESGSRSWVAYGRGPPTSAPDCFRVGSRLSVYAHGALTRSLDRHGLGSRTATLALLDRIRSLAPDVIHLQNIHGYYLHYEILFAFLKAAGTPVVWTLHDCWPFTGHCCHFDFAGCSRWKTHCRACPERASYPSSWLLDGSASNHDRKKRAFGGLERLVLVTPSRWLADQVGSSFLRGYPTEVIPNGIDRASFAPVASADIRRRLGIPPEARVALGVAADFASPRKGLEFLLDLAHRLERDSILVLVGVPPAIIPRLPNNVIGIRRTECVEDLAALYSTATVFVNPTLEDNFPTVALEALSCGTPVVTFATGGCPEQVTDKTGRVVARGDSRELARVVIGLLREGKAETSLACRAHSSRYSAEVMAADYLRLYEKVARQPLSAPIPDRE